MYGNPTYRALRVIKLRLPYFRVARLDRSADNAVETSVSASRPIIGKLPSRGLGGTAGRWPSAVLVPFRPPRDFAGSGRLECRDDSKPTSLMLMLHYGPQVILSRAEQDRLYPDRPKQELGD